MCVSNGQRGYNFFGQMGTSPKSVSFGEVAPAGAAWKRGGSAFTLEGRDQPRGLKGSEEGASGRSKRDSASEAWPSEVRSFLGPESSLPQSWGPSRGSSASTETVSAQGVREALSTDPSPGPIL